MTFLLQIRKQMLRFKTKLFFVKLDSGNLEKYKLYASKELVEIYKPGIGKFKITDGKKIIYSPLNGVRVPNLIVFLLSNVFAYLLYQRGYLVFHASSVCINGNSYFFCGRSGSGKSTILSKLLDHGEFISEDIVCIGKEFDSILCSFPFIKLADNISFKNQSIHYTLTDARNRKIYPINTKINKKNKFSKGFFLKVSNCNSAKKINTNEAFKYSGQRIFFIPNRE